MDDLWALQWKPFGVDSDSSFRVRLLKDFVEDNQAIFGEAYITEKVDMQKVWIPLVIGTVEQCEKSLKSLYEHGVISQDVATVSKLRMRNGSIISSVVDRGETQKDFTCSSNSIRCDF